MIAKTLQLFLILALWSCPEKNLEDWHKLDGVGITGALTARVLQYSGATQNFYTDGRTLYETQEPSWGKWRVENDQYCSVWPPTDGWVCYDLERHEDGLRVRFIDSNGGITEGKYIDLN